MAPEIGYDADRLQSPESLEARMRRTLAACLAVTTLVAGAFASMPARADVSFHGFGQAAVGSTLGNNRSVSGTEYSADPSFTPETLLALQIQAPLSDKILATAQVVSTGAEGQEFTPKFEWAYVSYWLGDHWLFKAGRQRLPLYRYSESLEVGESYTWIRPPLSVYQSSVNDFDGLSATGDYEFGKWTLQPELNYGTANNHYISSGTTFDFNAPRGYGAALALGYEHLLQIRGTLNYGTGSLVDETALPQLQAVLSNSVVGNPPVPADNSALVNAYGPQNHSLSFYGGSVDFHPGHWHFLGEYHGVHYPGPLVQKERGYYVAASYTADRWTPILTYGHYDRSTGDPSVLGLLVPDSQCPTGGFNPSTLQPIYESCASLLTSALLNSSRELIDYYEAGIRYDVTDHAALKFDWTRSLMRQAPGYGPPDAPRASNVVSAALVFDF